MFQVRSTLKYFNVSCVLTRFQRLKGAIDSRIAEEQARQRSSQASPSRKNSGTNRSSSRNISPSKRGVRSQAREKKDGEPSKRDRDPSEFEPESIAESEDTPSRSESPRPIQKIGEAASADETAKMEGSKVAIAIKEGKIDSPDNAITSQELPTDIRVKLRKLDKLESRYNGTWNDIVCGSPKANRK